MSLDRIETRSLILSAHALWDAEDAYRVESNPKVMQFLGGEYRCPKEQFLRDFRTGYVDRFPEHMAVRRKGDRAYIGNCSLTEWLLADRDSQPLVAAIQPRIVIDEPYWRNMYGVEALRALLSHAFGPMQANIVAGVIDPRHHRMHEICSLYGFRRDRLHSLCLPTQAAPSELWVVTRKDFEDALKRRLEQAS